MAIGNDRAHWVGVSRALHWGMAALIAIEVPAGFVMSRTYATRDPALMMLQHLSANIHHTLGLTLLLLVAIRGLWRLFGDVPEGIGTQAERSAMRGAHGLIYALLFLIPLSGWAALSALRPGPQFPNPLWIFGQDGFGPDGWVPRLVPAVPWDAPTLLRYGTFATTHRWLLIAGAALLFLHVAAALRRHFILRDDTLRHMLKDVG